MFNNCSLQTITVKAKYISDGPFGDWVSEYEGTSRTEANLIINKLIADDEVYDMRIYAGSRYTAVELQVCDAAASGLHKMQPAVMDEDDLPF